MVNLDLKDRKILYQLDINCRQSNRQIGKKVGLSREVVNYRIKRMEKEGIITNYFTAIDTYILGYQVFRIYINFKEISSDVKNEIIKYFVNNKNTWAVISFKGEIDFDVIFWVKDVNQFYSYWNKTLEKLGKYFSHHIITPLFQVITFKKNYLLQNQNEKMDNIHYKINYSGKLVEIDKIDYQLLNEIVLNARIPLIKLAEKIGCSSQAVKYRINNLIRNDIIKAFQVDLDLSKLGLQKFGLQIYLADPSRKGSILDYLKCKPYLEYINEGVGFADIQIELIVENITKLMEIMEDVDTKFPGAIKKQTFLVSKEYHKSRWLPEMEFK